MAEEKGLWVLKGEEEKEALRVGTDWGRGLRPEEKRPPQAPEGAGPPPPPEDEDGRSVDRSGLVGIWEGFWRCGWW